MDSPPDRRPSSVSAPEKITLVLSALEFRRAAELAAARKLPLRRWLRLELKRYVRTLPPPGP